ncbi:hypothetical protein ACN47E_007197 [Coniothyrium glycines]
MATFDVFQAALDRKAVDATTGDESEQLHQASSPAETPSTGTQSGLATSSTANTTSAQTVTPEPVLAPRSGVADTTPGASDSKDREIVRLQRTITGIKTNDKAKELQLGLAREELNNAREALNETFAEYSRLRGELKAVKQNLGKDHQAVVYRKDIELFALRKGNEQKEKQLKDREAKLEEMHRQQRTVIEIKDAQLKLLEDRLSLMNRQANPKFDHEAEEGDQALEVRLLRIRKGRGSPADEEDKDALISKLQEQLAVATKAAQDVINQQAELQRAWDVAKKLHNTLKEEREKHTQTREQLQEVTVKLTEQSDQKPDRTDDNGRLPTITEDERDQEELEAMFDTAQQDNLRLYAEVSSLEQRLKDSNARMFAALQDVEALRNQLHLEKAINKDMEAARPSVVHRVHFERMEGQLKEARDDLANKDNNIKNLRSIIIEKESIIGELRGEVDAAVTFHTQDQDEIERLTQSISELQETKQQLMLDHERLALQRTRQRIISLDRTSARSKEPTNLEALPAMPIAQEAARASSIPETSNRHRRSQSNPDQLNLTSTTTSPPDPRDLKKSHRRSLGLKDLMRKIVRKDPDPSPPVAVEAEAEAPPSTPHTPTHNLDRTRMRNALNPKDTNAPLRRPQTAVPTPSKPFVHDAVPAASPSTAPVPQSVKPRTEKRRSLRYYARPSPSPSAMEQGSLHVASSDGVDGEESRPSSRRSWGATNRLVRRSLQ